MTIRIEGLSKEMKNDAVKIGGVINYYSETDEDGIIVTFYHHELITQGDVVKIVDELTGKELFIDRVDFYTIEIV